MPRRPVPPEDDELSTGGDIPADAAFQDVTTPPSAPPESAAPFPPSREERLWAMAAYLAGRAMPLVAPLAIYVARRDQSAFVAFHAKQSLMLDVACLAASGAAYGLAHILRLIPLAGAIMGWMLFISSWAVFVLWLLGGIVLAVQAFDGQRPRFGLFDGCCGIGED